MVRTTPTRYMAEAKPTHYMARTKTCILYGENKIGKPYFENKTGMFISLSLTKKDLQNMKGYIVCLERLTVVLFTL